MRLEGALGQVIEPAKTGRSRCRVCRRAIPKGSLRLGAPQHAFTDAMDWFHLRCVPVPHQRAAAELAERWPGAMAERDRLVEGSRTRTVAPPDLLAVLVADPIEAGERWLAWWRSCGDADLGALFGPWVASQGALGPTVQPTTEALLGLTRANRTAVGRIVAQAVPDPRWVDVVHRWLDKPPYAECTELFTDALALLDRCADVRTLALATELANLTEPAAVRRFGTWTGRLVLRWARVRASGFPAFVERSPGPDASVVQALRARVEARGGQRRERQEELHQRLSDAVDDPGARLVLADLLLERGDVRGELLTLEALGRQASPAQRERRRALKKDPAILGALAPLATKSATRLRDGLVVGLGLKPRRAGQEGLLHAWEWASVESLEVKHDARGRADVDLVFAPGATRLHTVRVGDQNVLGALLTHGSTQPSVREIQVRDLAGPPRQPSFSRRSLPGLEVLRVTGAPSTVARWQRALPDVHVVRES